MTSATIYAGIRDDRETVHPSPNPSPDKPSQDGKRRRLLVVDDDRLVLATLADGLRKAGYDVSTAVSGKDAIEMASAAQFDLAILDVRMPGMDGIELARHLRQGTTIPFLFLSAYGEIDLVRRAADFGALGYLIKPADIPQIVPAIEAALARAEEIARLRSSEERLNTALVIEQKTRTAVGLLMERHGFNRQQAFEVLRSQARSQRRKIAEVADRMIDAAETLNAPASKDPPDA